MAGKTVVCIPTYQRAALLQPALASVLAQTISDLEIIVSDNASADQTAQVVTAFHDDRIHYQRHSANLGLTANLRSAINAALQRPRVEFIAILSDDDLFLPGHLDCALAALREYPQAVYYSCPASLIGDKATGEMRPLALSHIQAPLTFFPAREAVRFLGQDTPGVLMTTVCRHAAFRQDLFWGPPGYMPVDLLIMPQLLLQGGFVFGTRPTACYRFHPGNISAGAGKRRTVRRDCMTWYTVRYVAQRLIHEHICSLVDIENQGLTASHEAHVVPLVLGLASWDSPAAMRETAQRIFRARTDLDRLSARFRLARRCGFALLPLFEKLSQLLGGWRPQGNLA